MRFKSAVFAALLICFHIIEETFIGIFHGKTFFQSIPSIGGGKLQGILMVGVIMFVVLMPFFAFRELDRAIGTEELRSLLFGDKTEAGATPPIMRTSWRTAAAAAFAVLVIGGGWLIWALNRGTATPEPVVGTVTASVVGTAATTPVGARVSGVIQALECGVNMKVKAGQFCAKIDPRPFQIMVDQNKSDLADAETRFERDKAALTEAKAAFEHREALAKRRAISQKAIDKSRKVYEQAQAWTKHDEATVAQLQAALHAAETDLSYTEIVAPVDGTVVSRNVEIGQTVAAGSEAPPLFLIATDPSAPN
jgi:multidrug resistance efflux pump